MDDKVTVICDRCGKTVDGLHVAGPKGFTAGYYDTSGPNWSKYADPDEKIICDDCMWKDSRYLADYGPANQVKGTTLDLPNG